MQTLRPAPQTTAPRPRRQRLVARSGGRMMRPSRRNGRASRLHTVHIGLADPPGRQDTARDRDTASFLTARASAVTQTDQPDLYANYPLGHGRPFHGLNPPESARNHRYRTPTAAHEIAANRELGVHLQVPLKRLPSVPGRLCVVFVVSRSPDRPAPRSPSFAWLIASRVGSHSQ